MYAEYCLLTGLKEIDSGAEPTYEIRFELPNSILGKLLNKLRLSKYPKWHESGSAKLEKAFGVRIAIKRLPKCGI